MWTGKRDEVRADDTWRCNGSNAVSDNRWEYYCAVCLNMSAVCVCVCVCVCVVDRVIRSGPDEQ